MPSPYEILQVHPDADDDEIEAAYRRRVKEAHPDHGGSARAFRRVTAAYEEITEGDWNGPRGVEGVGAAGVDVGERDGAVEGTAEGRGVGGRGPAGDDDRHGPLEAEVEYLNYEVLDDHGWTLGDDDLFEKASTAGLDASDYGRIQVGSHESLLEGVEDQGCTWPYACRGGACANCAVAVTDGELSMPVDHILPTEMTDRRIQLSCVGTPVTEELKVVFNVKHLPDLDDLRLPPRPFRQANPSD